MKMVGVSDSPPQFKVVDNFLRPDYFDKIQKTVMGNNFAWYFVPIIADKELDSDGYFVHNFFMNTIRSQRYDLILPLLDALPKWQTLIRCKANLYTRQAKVTHHDYHKDLTYQHNVFLLSLNNNDGPFTVGKEEIPMKENRAVFFKSQTPHRSSACSDVQVRVTLTVNYIT